MSKVDMGESHRIKRQKGRVRRVQGKSKACRQWHILRKHSDFGSDIRFTCSYMIPGKARQDLCRSMTVYTILDFSSNLHHSKAGKRE